MKYVDQIFVAGMLMIVSMSAPAYNLLTHERMSGEAVRRSKLAGPQSVVLRALGFDGSETFVNRRGIKRTIGQLIQDGSVFEDSSVRAINHFYDPVSDAALLPVIAKPSPDWTLEDKDSVVFQNYSFRDGRDYLYKALTSTYKADRDSNFRLMFETVGRVIHHIQDMAQPQHVQSDTIAQYAIVRPNGSHYSVYLIYFVTDENGIWRLDEM